MELSNKFYTPADGNRSTRSGKSLIRKEKSVLEKVKRLHLDEHVAIQKLAEDDEQYVAEAREDSELIDESVKRAEVFSDEEPEPSIRELHDFRFDTDPGALIQTREPSDLEEELKAIHDCRDREDHPPETTTKIPAARQVIFREALS